MIPSETDHAEKRRCELDCSVFQTREILRQTTRVVEVAGLSPTPRRDRHSTLSAGEPTAAAAATATGGKI